MQKPHIYRKRGRWSVRVTNIRGEFDVDSLQAWDARHWCRERNLEAEVQRFMREHGDTRVTL